MTGAHKYGFFLLYVQTVKEVNCLGKSMNASATNGREFLFADYCLENLFTGISFH
jgi:hypothetical protein